MYDLKQEGASGYQHAFNKYVFSAKYKMHINQPVEFKEFENRMKSYDLGGIIKNIQLYINYIEDEISQKKYLSQSQLFSKTKREIEAEAKAQEEKKKLEKSKKRKQEKFYSVYPNFKEINLRYDVNRQEVNALLFKYNDKYPSFIKFQSAMKQYDIKELFEKLDLAMEE